MPLSDHEQRLLEQMERALYQEDPKWATSLRHGRSGNLNRKRVAAGAAGAVLGLVVVVVGVALALPALGAVGFVMMVAGVFWAWSGARTGGADEAAPTPKGLAPSSVPKVKGSSAFMAKMEDRWRKRREGGQRF